MQKLNLESKPKKNWPEKGLYLGTSCYIQSVKEKQLGPFTTYSYFTKYFMLWYTLDKKKLYQPTITICEKQIFHSFPNDKNMNDILSGNKNNRNSIFEQLRSTSSANIMEDNVWDNTG